ncbi:quaternary amine ABC transporter ATP-binding protein [Marivita sp.]|uniref:quaternary amine ABC transporter ATP-binding protein n=1 Tax=Marivita sp. TaxID=2003365 RepID=UPI003A8427FF
MTNTTADPAPVRLCCRNVWKVYGADPDRFFEATSGPGRDAATQAAEIRAAGHIVANADVSFDVHEGEIFVIMGLSGSGKSTILRCLSRLVEPTAGEILLDGEDLLKKSTAELIEIRRHKMGMVFQSFGLMPHLNVIDNIAFPLKLQGMRADDRYACAARVIDLVGLAGREHDFPNALSGGQQQRVGIARSLAVEPDVWFLDEPFSALDPLIRKQMQNEFLRIQSQLRKSIVFITHDFQEALRIADRMAIMRDGAVVQIGRPIDLILNPADDYIRDFTQDVPWERIMCARDIMEPADGPLDGLRRVPADVLVESLLTDLASAAAGVVVEGTDGAVLGIATARSFAASLARGCMPTNPPGRA